jgi:RNA polymerase sigma factor (sigma-70 family)
MTAALDLFEAHADWAAATALRFIRRRRLQRYRDELTNAGLWGLYRAAQRFQGSPEAFRGFAAVRVIGAMKDEVRQQTILQSRMTLVSIDEVDNGGEQFRQIPAAEPDNRARETVALLFARATPDQCRILEALAAGRNLSEIGRAEGVTHQTIRNRLDALVGRARDN